MPTVDIDYYPKMDPKRRNALNAWEAYYFARGVSRFRCRTLAEQKCRRSNNMPPA